MDMLQIIAVAVIAALCSVLLKERALQMGILLSIAACLILFLGIVPALTEVKGILEELGALTEISPVILEPVIKSVGLGIITKLAAGICRDAKENSLASFVEMAGSIGVLLLALPLLRMVLHLIGGLL